ncbi:MAG: PDZ domain-containing protein [Bacteroidota bacterium]
MNKKSVFILLFALSFGASLWAQQPDPQPTEKDENVIIIKTIDENGNEKVETIVLDGKRGETIIIDEGEGELIEIEINGEDVQLIEKEVILEQLEKSLEQIEEKQMEVEVEIERILEDVEVEIERAMEEIEDMQIHIEVLTEEGEGPNVFEWHSKEGEPLSEELLEELAERGIILEDFEFMTENEGPRAFLGVMISQEKSNENGIEEDTGMVISGVTNDGPAAAAGIQKEDVIKGIDGKELSDFNELIEYLKTKNPGDTVELSIERGKKMLQIPVTLGEKESQSFKEFRVFGEDMDGEMMIIIKDEKGKKKTKIKKIKIKEMGRQEIEEVDFDMELGGDLSMADLKIGPNPTTDVISLSFSTQESGDLDIQVLNLNGRTVYKEYMSDFSGSYSNDLDLSGQAPGTYLLQIRQGSKQWVEELVLQ